MKIHRARLFGLMANYIRSLNFTVVLLYLIYTTYSALVEYFMWNTLLEHLRTWVGEHSRAIVKGNSNHSVPRHFKEIHGQSTQDFVCGYWKTYHLTALWQSIFIKSVNMKIWGFFLLNKGIEVNTVI